MFKDLKVIFFMAILSSISITLLSIGDSIYQEINRKSFYQIYGQIMSGYNMPFNEESIEQDFFNSFREVKKGTRTYYLSTSTDKNSIVYITEGPGLWSIIKLLIRVDSDRNYIRDVTVLEQAETPGLGGRITEDEFLDQFHGVLVRPELLVVKRAVNKNEVDAISGATMTSRAVEDIINGSIMEMDRDLQGVTDVP